MIDLAAFHASLTTLQSEDWNVICDGSTVHVIALREDAQGETSFKAGMTELRAFKKFVRNLSVPNDLGCVTVLLGKDADQTGGLKLCAFLHRLASRKDYKVMIVAGNRTTAESVAGFTAWVLRHCMAEGQG